MIQEAALQADRIGIPLLACNVQVLPVVEEPMAVCTVNVGFAGSEVSQMRTKNSVQADKEIVMTKWIGLEPLRHKGLRAFCPLSHFFFTLL